MSEFSCKNMHLMSCSDRVCRVCGESMAYMDGMSESELMKRLSEEQEEECEEDE
jgi:hypothetical protein